MNNKITCKRYPRYNQVADWQYIVQCDELSEVNEIFIEKVGIEMKKNVKIKEENDIIEYIMIDINKFLYSNNGEYMINWVIIG